MKTGLVTVSYRGDLALASELCDSVDRFVEPDISHVLIVPQTDKALFAPLAGARRQIVTVEEVLPKSFRRVMPSCRIEVKPFFSKRLREMWLTPAGLVRGWIIQQIVKLSSEAATEADIIVFADSDLVFVAPLTNAHFMRGDRARLYLRPGETKESDKHRKWHAAAARLLGLPASDYFGADYIGNPISWRRDTLAKLKARIAEVAHRPWQEALAATPAFSEFILYGVFADHVLGDAAGHYPDERDFTHASWHYDGGRNGGFEAFARGLRPEHLAILVQSTEKLSAHERRALIAQMTARRDAGMVPSEQPAMND